MGVGVSGLFDLGAEQSSADCDQSDVQFPSGVTRPHCLLSCNLQPCPHPHIRHPSVTKYQKQLLWALSGLETHQEVPLPRDPALPEGAALSTKPAPYGPLEGHSRSKILPL